MVASIQKQLLKQTLTTATALSGIFVLSQNISADTVAQQPAVDANATINSTTVVTEDDHFILPESDVDESTQATEPIVEATDTTTDTTVLPATPNVPAEDSFQVPTIAPVVSLQPTVTVTSQMDSVDAVENVSASAIETTEVSTQVSADAKQAKRVPVDLTPKATTPAATSTKTSESLPKMNEASSTYLNIVGSLSMAATAVALTKFYRRQH